MKISLISQATNTVELEEALESKLYDMGFELDPSSTYEENLDWFEQDNEDGNEDAAEILKEAVAKWHELQV